MPLKYHSGDEIKKGDQILYGSSRGVVEFVADPAVDDPNTKWYVEEYGGGAMLMTELYGAVFASRPNEEEDLELAGRAETMFRDGARS